MYGFNYTLDANGNKISTNNTTPFNGIGRLHNSPTFPTVGAQDEFNLVNYKAFLNSAGTALADGFVRDPERPGFRASLGATKQPWLGGFNAPYTYPDLNNMFLAVVDSSGNVLQPSYFRQAVFGGALDNVGNANWTNAAGKYLILRPRPADNAGFPYPEDSGGDVKNLLGNPGGNDSIWTDGGSPVRTAPNGKTYKAMFAPLIVELDSRLNLVTHGNVLGGTLPSPIHVSNTGWGPWSVNLSKVLTDLSGGTLPAPTNSEWGNIFSGIASPAITGRYGSDGLPGSGGTAATGTFPFPAGQAGVFPTLSAKGYSQINFDEGSGGPGNRSVLTSAFVPSVATGYIPTYLGGYTTGAGAAQLTNHPLAYNVFAPAGGDRAFSLNSMEALLRFNDTTSYALSGDLLSLCPNVFSQQRARSMVTTRAFDLDVPGLAPALPTRTGAYQLTVGGTLPSRPQAGAVTFPTTAQILAPPTPSDFTANDGRMNYVLGSALSILSKKLDLNRPLPDYPQPASGVMPTNAAFYAAQQARQDLAKDIFDRLRLITGADDPANFSSPTPPPQAAKDALRWLAQLAVNIVDFIDNDDIMTPFNWSSTPTDIVYGVEQPRVLINEVLVQYKIPTSGPNANKTLVDVWVELMNPGKTDSTLFPAGDNGGARMHTASFDSYQLSICKFGSFSKLTTLANSTGVPDSNPTSPSSPPDQLQVTVLPSGMTPCQVTNFSTVPNGGVLPAYNGTAGQGFLLVGSKTPLTTAGPPVFGNAVTVDIQDAGNLLSYTFPVGSPPPQAPTILLQRLANPYMAQNGTTNPFVAVDIFQNACGDTSGAVPLTNNVTTASNSASSVRPNPFIDQLSRHATEPTAPMPSSIKNSFKAINSNETGPNPWLVQLDRYLSSPIELLNVPGCKPQELTQYFGDTSVASMGTFNHRAPWFDEDLGGSTAISHRLYRFFELVETRSHMAGMEPAVFQTSPAGGNIAAGSGTAASPISVQSLSVLAGNGSLVTISGGDILTIMGFDTSGNPIMENVRVLSTTTSPSPGIILLPGTSNPTPTTINQSFTKAIIVHTGTGGRVAGKLNINTVLDAEIFNALCDPTTANSFTSSVPSVFSGIGTAIHTGSPGVPNWTDPRNDQPFQGMGMAQITSAPAPDLLQLTSSGVNRTYFRPVSPTNLIALLEPNTDTASTHPVTRFELLNKIYNNTTSRSNVFAVWLTVGFFECDANGNNLGPEIGKSEGKSIRHRMFAIVDRTGLAVPRQAGTFPPLPFSGVSVGTAAQTVSIVNLLGSSAGSTSGINVGTNLLIGNPGSPNVEVVQVLGVNASQIQAVFTQAHAASEPVSIMPGNWGPQPGFDVTQPVNSQIVPYYSIIE